MSITAGDLKQAKIIHEELGNLIVDFKVGEDYNKQRGGYKSEDDDGNFSTSGERIDKKVRYPWSFEATAVAKTGYQKYLQDLANNTVEAEIVFTYIDDSIQGARGTVVGDIIENKQAGTIPVKFSGGGELEDIV